MDSNIIKLKKKGFIRVAERYIEKMIDFSDYGLMLIDEKKRIVYTDTMAIVGQLAYCLEYFRNHVDFIYTSTEVELFDKGHVLETMIRLTEQGIEDQENRYRVVDKDWINRYSEYEFY